MKEEKKDKPGKKKKDHLQMTELFGAKKGKNGWGDFYSGAIYRENDDAGNEIAVNGNIYMEGEGMFWSRDISQAAYSENLDSILELRLDYGIHKSEGISSMIGGSKFFHN